MTYTAISNAAGGGGGGGSDLVSGTNTTETAGSGVNAGNNTDADYAGNAGKGGTGGTSPTAGKDGLVVLAYQVTSGADGTLCTGVYGTPSVTAGKVGQAASFGTITHGGTFATTTTNSNVQTIAFWLHEATSTADDILQVSSGAYVTWSSAGAITTTGITSPTTYVNGVAGATSVATSTWTHVVITTGTPILADDVRLGNVAATLGYFDGTLDDVRLYSSVLTAAEVSRLYQLNNTFYEQKTLATNSNTTSGLLAHWSFDGPSVSGSTISDVSSSGQSLGFWTDTVSGSAGCAAGFTDIGGGQCRRFLTSGTTFTAPSNWSSTNTIEAVGAGGNGAAAVTDDYSGGGGGGGEYRKITNQSLTASGVYDIQVGTGGGGAGTGDTWLKGTAGGGGSKILAAIGGGNATTQGAAGAGGTGGTGAGGNANGGTGGVGADSASRNGGGGGGGSAGPTGAGQVGGASGGTVTGGSGGGGSNGGSSTAGSDSTGTTGGAGGQGTSGAGSGAGGASDTDGTAGTVGGGGGGSGGSNTSAHTGGAGGCDTAWDATHGACGGGGGGGDAGASNPGATGGAGGTYGGGGGGGGESQSGTSGSGGAGTQGILVVTYTPAAGGTSSAQSSMTPAAGQVGQGMSLASTTGAVTSGTATYATTTNIATGVKTVAFWMYPAVATQSILQFSSSAYVTESSNTLATTGITDPTTYVNGVSGATALTLNAWNHVVITTASAITASDFRLGKIAGQTNPYFSGNFDDVYLYNRAITQSEVTRLYQQGQGSTVNKTLATPVPSTTNLLLWYTFDGPKLLTMVADSSGNGRTGQLTGATTTAPGKLGQALSFNGTSNFITESASISNIQTVAFWARASTTRSIAQGLINLTDTTVYVSTNSSKVLSGTGFTSPTYYADGVASTTPGLYDDNWHHFVVTSTAAITGSTIQVGKANSVFFGGSMDDVRFYSGVLSASSVLRLSQQ
ncbi:MAG: LamG-like jellyroll fold domain-containing protein [Phycisphaerales bacterium]|nr:LamG-like jellyroll fold domain-containing protein [Phycisphaerales bacterium]